MKPMNIIIEYCGGPSLYGEDPTEPGVIISLGDDIVFDSNDPVDGQGPDTTPEETLVRLLKDGHHLAPEDWPDWDLDQYDEDDAAFSVYVNYVVEEDDETDDALEARNTYCVSAATEVYPDVYLVWGRCDRPNTCENLGTPVLVHLDHVERELSEIADLGVDVMCWAELPYGVELSPPLQENR